MAKTNKGNKARSAKVTSIRRSKKVTCPVCVNGKGQYLDISKHNKKHHGGRSPRKAA